MDGFFFRLCHSSNLKCASETARGAPVCHHIHTGHVKSAVANCSTPRTQTFVHLQWTARPRALGAVFISSPRLTASCSSRSTRQATQSGRPVPMQLLPSQPVPPPPAEVAYVAGILSTFNASMNGLQKQTKQPCCW